MCSNSTVTQKKPAPTELEIRGAITPSFHLHIFQLHLNRAMMDIGISTKEERLRFITAIQDILNQIADRERVQIRQTAGACAKSIQQGRVVLLFGAGHSALPCQEAFPRIGSIVGFLQITEPALSYNGHVVGKAGQRQMSYLERKGGFAEIILSNYDLDDEDTLIIFSNSGINALPVEMCARGNEIGLTTVGIGSKSHSFANEPKNKLDRRLLEIADIAIDNHTPDGDAVIEIAPGIHSGGSSTIANMVIINSIIVQTTAILHENKVPFQIYPSHNVSANFESVQETEEEIFQAYKQLRSKL